jgi:hypothetical protein
MRMRLFAIHFAPSSAFDGRGQSPLRSVFNVEVFGDRVVPNQTARQDSSRLIFGYFADIWLGCEYELCRSRDGKSPGE